VSCPFPIEHRRGTPYDFHSADAGLCLEVAIGSGGAGKTGQNASASFWLNCITAVMILVLSARKSARNDSMTDVSSGVSLDCALAPVMQLIASATPQDMTGL
jgi:hypothetical protein